ncbi:hypothetical protein AB0J20_01400 [Micromonospora costi]|uniref:hypothetical protein n=1 Tax=Micromonospora costi TaxID=1530042 RepID=UPI0033F6F062
MALDHEVAREHDRAGDQVSTATVIGYTVAAVILFGWFLYGWLVLRQGFIDSVGEAAGTGFALLLFISVVGTVRRSRR